MDCLCGSVSVFSTFLIASSVLCWCSSINDSVSFLLFSISTCSSSVQPVVFCKLSINLWRNILVSSYVPLCHNFWPTLFPAETERKYLHVNYWKRFIFQEFKSANSIWVEVSETVGLYPHHKLPTFNVVFLTSIGLHLEIFFSINLLLCFTHSHIYNKFSFLFDSRNLKQSNFQAIWNNSRGWMVLNLLNTKVLLSVVEYHTFI